MTRTPPKPKVRLCTRCSMYSGQFVKVKFPKAKSASEMCPDCLSDLLLDNPQYLCGIKVLKCDK